MGVNYIFVVEYNPSKKSLSAVFEEEEGDRELVVKMPAKHLLSAPLFSEKTFQKND